MSEVNGYPDLVALNSKLVEACLRNVEGELNTIVEKLESCLELMTRLQHYELDLAPFDSPSSKLKRPAFKP